MVDLVSDTNTAPLQQGYKKSKKLLQKGLGFANNYLTEGKEEGLGYLDTGAEKASPYLEQAGQAYEGLYNDFAKPGMEGYWNLLTNPDSIYDSELYKSRENAGVEGINRIANSRGMLASGNNTQDILDYMRRGGLDYFNTLLGGYAPYNQMGLAATQGMAGAKTGLANLWNQLGQNKSNVTTGTAGALSGNTMGAYGDMARNRNQLGQDMTSIDMYDKAQDWNALMGLGNLAVGAGKAYMGA